MLRNGHGNARNVNFLKGISAQQAVAYVSGNRYHGDAVHICGGDPRYQVGGSRPAGSYHYTGLSRRPGVTVGRVRRPLFVGSQYVLNAILIFIERIVDVQHRPSGIAEDGIYALLDQNLR